MNRFDVYSLQYDQNGKAIGFYIPNCGFLFRFDKNGGWYDQERKYYNAQAKPDQSPSHSENSESSSEQDYDVTDYFEKQLQKFNLDGITKKGKKKEFIQQKRIFIDKQSHIEDNFKIFEQQLKNNNQKYRLYFKSKKSTIEIEKFIKTIQKDFQQEHKFQVHSQRCVYSSSSNTYQLTKGYFDFINVEACKQFYRKQFILIRLKNEDSEIVKINQAKTLDYQQNLMSRQNPQRLKIVQQLSKKINQINSDFILLRIQNVKTPLILQILQFLIQKDQCYSLRLLQYKQMKQNSKKQALKDQYHIVLSKQQALVAVQQFIIIRKEGLYLARQIVYVYVEGKSDFVLPNNYHYHIFFKTRSTNTNRDQLQKLIKHDLKQINLQDYYNLKTEVDSNSKRTGIHQIKFQKKQRKDYFINFDNDTFRIINISMCKP